MTEPDEELIRRASRDGDHAAFGELVLRHQSAVRRFLRQLTRGDTARADDLAQDTFVLAYRTIARFRGDAAFGTWLLGIAHNLWRNDRRRHPEPTATSPAKTEPTVAAASDSSDLRHDLALALEQLTPDEQVAVHLTYRQGLSHSEISDLLSCPIGTVKSHLARSKAKLRQLLAVWNPTL